MYHCYPLFLSHPIYFSTHMHMQWWCKITRCAFWALVNTVLRVSGCLLSRWIMGFLESLTNIEQLVVVGEVAFCFQTAEKIWRLVCCALDIALQVLKLGSVVVHESQSSQRLVTRGLQGNDYKGICTGMCAAELFYLSFGKGGGMCWQQIWPQVGGMNNKPKHKAAMQWAQCRLEWLPGTLCNSVSVNAKSCPAKDDSVQCEHG